MTFLESLLFGVVIVQAIIIVLLWLILDSAVHEAGREWKWKVE